MAKSKPAVEPKSDPNEVSSQDIMQQFLKDHEEEHFAFIKPKHEFISSGSLLLDSLVTIRSGGVVRLTGKGAELGKTSEAFVIADNYMKTMPNSKTIYFKAEARLTPEIIERSGLNFVFTAAEWVAGTVFVFPVNIFEAFAENLELLIPAMFKAGEHLCVILDSMDGLVLRADKAKELWKDQKKTENVKVAGVPKLTKELFRRLGLMITHYDVLMLITGQHTAAIQLDTYAPTEQRQTESSGGNAVAHQSDYVFEYQYRYQKHLILEVPGQKPHPETNKTIGTYVPLVIKKSATDVSGTPVEIPIRKGRKGSAIWVEREIVDLMLAWHWLTRAGSWLTFNASRLEEIEKATGVKLPEKVQGEDKACAIIENNPKVIPFLTKRLLDLISTDTQ